MMMNCGCPAQFQYHLSGEGAKAQAGQRAIKDTGKLESRTAVRQLALGAWRKPGTGQNNAGAVGRRTNDQLDWIASHQDEMRSGEARRGEAGWKKDEMGLRVSSEKTLGYVLILNQTQTANVLLDFYFTLLYSLKTFVGQPIAVRPHKAATNDDQSDLLIGATSD